ncbi:hypothetical protein TKK_0004741 [Trichogramma kaykai]
MARSHHSLKLFPFFDVCINIQEVPAENITRCYSRPAVPPAHARDCARYIIGAEGRVLELHSPDGVHECWLRASDSAEANVWFNALHSALAALTHKALRLASALPDPPQLQHIGWLARRHCILKAEK